MRRLVFFRILELSLACVLCSALCKGEVCTVLQDAEKELVSSLKKARALESEGDYHGALKELVPALRGATSAGLAEGAARRTCRVLRKLADPAKAAEWVASIVKEAPESKGVRQLVWRSVAAFRASSARTMFEGLRERITRADLEGELLLASGWSIFDENRDQASRVFEQVASTPRYQEDTRSYALFSKGFHCEEGEQKAATLTRLHELYPDTPAGETAVSKVVRWYASKGPEATFSWIERLFASKTLPLDVVLGDMVSAARALLKQGYPLEEVAGGMGRLQEKLRDRPDLALLIGQIAERLPGMVDELRAEAEELSHRTD